MPELAIEVLLAIAYALFLLAVALGLQRVARHTHRRVHRASSAGFHFHPHLNAWQCSRGELLWLREVDPERRLARYRARAHVCNRCSSKPGCTDSDDGREVVRSLDAWTRSEVGRFHRALSLVLVVLAAFVLTVAAVRHPDTSDLAALAGTFLPVGALAARLALGLRRPPGRSAVDPASASPQERWNWRDRRA